MGAEFYKNLFLYPLNDHMVFILKFVYVVYHTDLFADIKKSLHPWDSSHLVMVYDLFNVLLDSNCCYFVEDFTSAFIGDIGM